MTSNTTILIKKSTTSGNTPVALANGEIAINTADGKLFYGDPVGIVKYISNQNTFGTINVNSSLIVASNPTDILNIVSGNNVSIVTDTINKKITISATLSSNTSSFESISLGNSSAITSNSYTTSSTSQVTIDAFTASTYRSAKYEVQMTSGTDYHVTELRVVHDGTNVWLAQYGEIVTNGSLGNFDASISGGNFQLLFTPTNSVTTIKYYRNALLS